MTKNNRISYWNIILMNLSFIILLGCGGNNAEAGSKLFSTYGCAVCHSMKGEVLHGPALNEIWQKEIKVNRKGEMLDLTVDREYINRSIMDPEYEKVVGFESRAMPKTFISPEDSKSLVDYIVSMNNTK